MPFFVVGLFGVTTVMQKLPPYYHEKILNENFKSLTVCYGMLVSRLYGPYFLKNFHENLNDYIQTLETVRRSY